MDDETIKGYASQHGVHKFPDPDIMGHYIQDELQINSVHHCFLKKVSYEKKDIFPDWILKCNDWKKMKGIIKERELLQAMMTTNHLRDPIMIGLIRTWLMSTWDMARQLGLRRCTALAKALQYTRVKKNEVSAASTPSSVKARIARTVALPSSAIFTR